MRLARQAWLAFGRRSHDINIAGKSGQISLSRFNLSFIARIYDAVRPMDSATLQNNLQLHKRLASEVTAGKKRRFMTNQISHQFTVRPRMRHNAERMVGQASMPMINALRPRNKLK